MIRALVICPLAVAACAASAPTAEQLVPEYRGIRAEVLDHDLVRIQVEMTNALEPGNVSAYADCAAAGYTIGRGYGFARHVNSSVDKTGGVWRGDAIYTLSSALPDGIATIDAEVVAAHCREKGIPLV